MLFYGPPGTGKTSTVLALAKQLYGPELIKTRVLELNASDERGISIVREKVKNFARMQLSNPPAGPAGVEYRKKYSCPPYKIIILDEADSMTQDAQSALRRTMETYSKITRFCLICNYVTRIIDPLASRCSKFRFKSLDEGNAGRRIEDIARLEGVNLEDGVVETLLRCSEGDLRKAITFLQSASRLVGSGGAGGAGKGSKKKKEVDEDAMDVDVPAPTTAPISVATISEIAGVIPDATIDRLVESLQPKSKTASAPFQPISQAVEDLVAEGWYVHISRPCIVCTDKKTGLPLKSSPSSTIRSCSGTRRLGTVPRTASWVPFQRRTRDWWMEVMSTSLSWICACRSRGCWVLINERRSSRKMNRYGVAYKRWRYGKDITKGWFALPGRQLSFERIGTRSKI